MFWESEPGTLQALGELFVGKARRFNLPTGADEVIGGFSVNTSTGRGAGRELLFPYPREVLFVDDLPKTPSGKIQRYVLRQRVS